MAQAHQPKMPHRAYCTGCSSSKEGQYPHDVVKGSQAVDPVLDLEIQGRPSSQACSTVNKWIRVTVTDVHTDVQNWVWPQTKQRVDSLCCCYRHTNLKVAGVNERGAIGRCRAEVDCVRPQGRICLSCTQVLERNSPLTRKQGGRRYSWCTAAHNSLTRLLILSICILARPVLKNMERSDQPGRIMLRGREERKSATDHSMMCAKHCRQHSALNVLNWCSYDTCFP